MTGEPARLKVAIDIGPVYTIELPGHQEPDVLGTPVDRCARIAKHTKAGVVLASIEYVKACKSSKYRWTLVGEPELKGLGAKKIYQMGKKTIDIISATEIPETELRQLKDDLATANSQLEDATIEIQQLKIMNEALQKEIRELGKEPPEEHSVKDEETESAGDQLWDQIKKGVQRLRKLIEDAGVYPESQYARFLFLHMRNLGDEYNKFERKFDECIEKGLVEEDEEIWTLAPQHPRNEQAINLMNDLEVTLHRYETEFREEDPDELYIYSLTDADFWSEKVGSYVM